MGRPSDTLNLTSLTDAVYRANPALMVDHRLEHPWLTGNLGDPHAPVWFVAENPSLTQVKRVADAAPTPESQWSISIGDRLFRKMLVEHGFKDAPAEAPGGWRCYITDVIKSAAVVTDHRKILRGELLALAEAWAPVLASEMEQGRPKVVVSLGKKTDGLLSHLIEQGLVPRPPARLRIHHYAYITSNPDRARRLGPNHPVRLTEYAQQFAEVAAASKVANHQTLTLRLSDGRRLELGSVAQFNASFQAVVETNGGSSGRGVWSTLFGFAPAREGVVSVEYANRLALEAADYLATMELSLTPDAKALLRLLTSLASSA